MKEYIELQIHQIRVIDFKPVLHNLKADYESPKLNRFYRENSSNIEEVKWNIDNDSFISKTFASNDKPTTRNRHFSSIDHTFNESRDYFDKKNEENKELSEV